MFSQEFMRYLINYQKDDFKPEETRKEIHFNNKKGLPADVKIVVSK